VHARAQRGDGAGGRHSGPRVSEFVFVGVQGGRRISQDSEARLVTLTCSVQDVQCILSPSVSSSKLYRQQVDLQEKMVLLW
jgi:hypothetical protein